MLVILRDESILIFLSLFSLNISQLWLTLAERHLEQRGVDWKQAEKICFNEWSNPDDEELGIQIVKVSREKRAHFLTLAVPRILRIHFSPS